MSGWITVIFWGIVAGIIIGALSYLHHRVYEEGAASTCTHITADADCITQSELNQLIVQKEEYKNASAAREGELNTLKGVCEKQNTSVVTTAKITRAVQDATTVILGRIDANAKESADRISQWQADAAAKPPATMGDCNAQLKEVDGVLRDVLERMRH